MCNGESTRPSYGGTIAVIQPLAGRPQLKRELSLRLANDARTGSTMATIDGLSSPSNAVDAHFVIHRYGDLRLDASEAAVLHRFGVPEVVAERLSFPLAARLDLGVGGEGIIGRRISFVQGARVVGEGIIGWN